MSALLAAVMKQLLKIPIRGLVFLITGFTAALLQHTRTLKGHVEGHIK